MSNLAANNLNSRRLGLISFLVPALSPLGRSIPIAAAKTILKEQSGVFNDPKAIVLTYYLFNSFQVGLNTDSVLY